MPPDSYDPGLAGLPDGISTTTEKIMGETKSALTSKTVIGSIVSVVASISLVLGFDIGDTNGLIEQISAVIGGLLAIYGRVTAVKRIG